MVKVSISNEKATIGSAAGVRQGTAAKTVAHCYGVKDHVPTGMRAVKKKSVCRAVVLLVSKKR